MNKKLLFGMLAAVGLFATSCSEDDFAPAGNENEAVVSFTLGVNQSAQSRAGETAIATDVLYYQVFDLQGNTVHAVKSQAATTWPQTVNITLAKGQEYRVAFWAQDADCKAYTVQDLSKVIVTYDLMDANTSIPDAYCNYADIKVVGNQAASVTLTRPFAQVNVGVTQEDWDAAVASKVTVKNSKVVIGDVANVLNIWNLSVSGSQELTYDFAAIPTEKLTVDTDEYIYLAKHYILANDPSADQAGVTTSLAYTFQPQTGKENIEFSQGLADVPVRRNYRTNIVGTILTGKVDITVNVDNNFATPDNVITVDGQTTATTSAEAQDAIAAGANNVTHTGTGEQTVELPAMATGRAAVNTPASLVLNFPNATKVTIKYANTAEGANQIKDLEICAPSATGGIVVTTASTNVTLAAATSAEGVASTTYASADVTAKSLEVAEDVTVTSLKATADELNVKGDATITTDSKVTTCGEYFVDDAMDWTSAISCKAVEITLGANITLPTTETTTTIPTELTTLNLGGFTLSAIQLVWDATSDITISNGTLELSADKRAIVLKEGNSKFTLNNVKVNAPNANITALLVNNTSAQSVGFVSEVLGKNTIVIEKSTITVGTEGQGIVLHGQGNTLTVNGSTINSEYIGITQNGAKAGSKIEVYNSTVNGTYAGIYLANDANGLENTLVVEGSNISSTSTTEGSAIEVKKTDVSVVNSILTSACATQSYELNAGGTGSNGYGIALARYSEYPYEGSFVDENNTFNLAASNAVEVFCDYRTDGTNYYIGTAEGLFWFAKEVNDGKNMFAGKYVKLMNDIDLNNAAWTPIGQTGAAFFNGIIDGQHFTIKNLNIDSSSQEGADYSSGFFGWIEKHNTDSEIIKNVRFDGVTVKGHHNVGVVAGYLIGTIENCHVTNATLECSHANNDACGDKCGVIAGIAAETNAIIRNSTASNSTVKAGRDAGQIVGACIIGKVENCSATDVKVEAIGDCTGANVREELIGRTN